MKPPKCRLCGHEHWNREPHVWGKETPKVETVVTGVTKGVANNAKPVANRRSEHERPKVDAAESLISAGTVERLPGRPKGKETALATASRPSDVERVRKWREANRERYNALERERMRLKRSISKGA